MKEKYAYIGEVTVEEFAGIVKAFPNILGVGVTGNNDIILGVPTDLPEDVISLYQLVVAIYGNKGLIDTAWEAVEL